MKGKTLERTKHSSETSQIFLVLMVSMLLITPVFLFEQIQPVNAIRDFNDVAWAGYSLFGYEQGIGAGATARIFTIDPYMDPYILWKWIFWYVGVQFDYSNNYFMVLGYAKHYNAIPMYSPVYFYVKNDRWSNYGIALKSFGPTVGSTHSYYILHPYGWDQGYSPSYYELKVDTTFLWGDSYVYLYDPYCDPMDQFACVDSNSYYVVVNNTHFSNLKYFMEWIGGQWRWIRWSTHVEEQEFYTLLPISHYEFMASGGGYWP